MPPSDRRAPSGYTKAPFPCCGRDAGRGRPKTAGLCAECSGLIEDGRRYRAQQAQRTLETFAWTEYPHGWPCFYGSPGGVSGLSTDAHRALSNSFFELVNAVTEAAPAGTGIYTPETHEWTDYRGVVQISYNRWPKLLGETVQGHDDRWSFERQVVVAPHVRAALNAVYVAIKAALTDAARNGRQAGSSILRQLAAGAVTVDEFNKRSSREEDPT